MQGTFASLLSLSLVRNRARSRCVQLYASEMFVNARHSALYILISISRFYSSLIPCIVPSLYGA